MCREGVEHKGRREDKPDKNDRRAGAGHGRVGAGGHQRARSGAAVPAGLTAPGSSQIGYFPTNLTLSRSFPVQTKSIPDFTFRGGADALITARTDKGLRAALATGLIALANIRCWDAHEWNPTSDHPLGKACDLFQGLHVGHRQGHRLAAANWFVANQAVLGINDVSWQDKIWTAGSPRARGPYYSTVYGCPDDTNITGCPMDHIHVSFY